MRIGAQRVQILGIELTDISVGKRKVSFGSLPSLFFPFDGDEPNGSFKSQLTDLCRNAIGEIFFPRRKRNHTLLALLLGFMFFFRFSGMLEWPAQCLAECDAKIKAGKQAGLVFAMLLD